MIWAPFLHWYQPPDQLKEVLSNVINQCYSPLILLLEKYPRSKITLNINGCLTEQLAKTAPRLITRLKKLILSGKIELVASAKYHPLLPLITSQEISRQIFLNKETNNIYFGQNCQPVGFFPSELAYNQNLIPILIKENFSWVLLDEISLNGSLNNEGFDCLYRHKKYSKIKLFFADRQISHTMRAAKIINPKSFTNYIKNKVPSNQYLITANDGETFGHHYPKREKILEEAYKDQDIQVLNFSEIIKTFSAKVKSVIPQKGSWETTEEDFNNKLYYPLWSHPKNKIHKLQWRLTRLAMKYFSETKPPRNDINFAYSSSRKHLDKGLHSCHFWWASANPWWNPDIIVNGATEIIRAIRGLQGVSLDEKRKAEKIYAKIIQTTWEWHWSGEAQKRIWEFDQNKKEIVIL